MVKTRFELLRRRHPKVKKEVAMHRSRKENIRHFFGEPLASSRREEVRSVRSGRSFSHFMSRSS